MRRLLPAICIALGLVSVTPLYAAAPAAPPKVLPAPPRHEGEGPYSQLILRNVTVINGTGAPAFGPADVVIENNRIVQVMSVGAPGDRKSVV